MSKVFMAGCAAALLGLAIHSPALASNGFIGSTVTATVYYPDLSTPGFSVSETVGSGVEFPVYSVLAAPPAFTFPFTINVTHSDIVIHNYYSYAFPDVPFDGLLITFSGAPDIVGLTGSCTRCSVGSFPGEGIFFTSNSFIDNAAGATVRYGDTDTEHFTFAPTGTPEPATWAMMLLGLGGVGAFQRYRRSGRVGAWGT